MGSRNLSSSLVALHYEALQSVVSSRGFVADFILDALEHVLGVVSGNYLLVGGVLFRSDEFAVVGSRSVEASRADLVG